MKNDDLIGVAEAAVILGVDRSTVTRRAAKGHLQPAGRLPGRRGALVFRRGDVQR